MAGGQLLSQIFHRPLIKECFLNHVGLVTTVYGTFLNRVLLEDLGWKLHGSISFPF